MGASWSVGGFEAGICCISVICLPPMLVSSVGSVESGSRGGYTKRSGVGEGVAVSNSSSEGCAILKSKLKPVRGKATVN